MCGLDMQMSSGMTGSTLLQAELGGCLQILVTYGQYALQMGTVANPYGEKYKGIWLSLTILSRALSGNYVNFGVFDLYGDPALKVIRPGSHLMTL